MVSLLERIEALWCSLPEAAQDAMDEDHLERCIRLIGFTNEDEQTMKAVIWDFMRRIRQLRAFRKMTFAPQRSAEWLELRKNLLTASDLASALGKGKFTTRPKLLQSKADARRQVSLTAPLPPLPTDTNAPKPYKSPALSWGTMFEPMIARIYSERHGDIGLYEFGLIRHPTLACFGASPDGITETGKMVEIKCPWKRVIQAGEVPEQYYLQIQGQLSVCQLDHCDYIEVVMDDIPDAATYYERVSPDATHAHGVIIEYQTADDTLHDRVSYEYSPAKMTPTAAYEWATQWVRAHLADPTLHVMRLRPWRMTQMNLVPVHYDPDLWNTLVPQIQQFWNEVEEKTNAPVAGFLNEAPDAPMEQAMKPKVSRPRKTAKYTYRDEPVAPEPVKPEPAPSSATPKYTYRDDADD